MYEDEQTWRTEVRMFLRAFARHGTWWLSATVGSGSVAFLQAVGIGFDFPAWALCGIACTGVGMAAFLTWKDEYYRSISAREQLGHAQNKVVFDLQQKLERTQGELQEVRARHCDDAVIKEVAEAYILLEKQFPTDCDEHERLNLMVQAGILRLEEIPNGLPRVEAYLKQRGRPPVLSGNWDFDKLFPLVHWAVERGHRFHDMNTLLCLLDQEFYGHLRDESTPPSWAYRSAMRPLNTSLFGQV